MIEEEKENKKSGYKYSFLIQCYECRDIKWMMKMKRVYSMVYKVQGLLCESCFDKQDDTVQELSPHLTPEELLFVFN